MFVVVEHAITNPDLFFGLVSKVGDAPSGFKVLQFFPSTNKDRAVCMWEATSVDTLKGFLDPMSSQCSRNTYYAVDSSKAIGIPTTSAK